MKRRRRKFRWKLSMSYYIKEAGYNATKKHKKGDKMKFMIEGIEIMGSFTSAKWKKGQKWE